MAEVGTTFQNFWCNAQIRIKFSIEQTYSLKRRVRFILTKERSLRIFKDAQKFLSGKLFQKRDIKTKGGSINTQEFVTSHVQNDRISATYGWNLLYLKNILANHIEE